jgi:hypothetical protein
MYLVKNFLNKIINSSGMIYELIFMDKFIKNQAIYDIDNFHINKK